MRKLLSSYVKGLVSKGKFLGYCPDCGFIIGGIDIVTLHAKEHSKLRIYCKKCDKKMSVKKLKRKNPFIKIKRVRTKFPRPQFQQMYDQFVHLYGLEVVFGDRLTVEYRESLLKQGITIEEIDYVEKNACKRTKLNDNRWVADRVKAQTGEEAEKTITSFRR